MGGTPTDDTQPKPVLKPLTEQDRLKANQARGMQLDGQLGILPGSPNAMGGASYVHKVLSDEEKALAAELEKKAQPDIADTLLRSAQTGGFMRARSSRGRRASFLSGAYDTSTLLGGR
jgi:hypothetical protein